MGIEEVVCRMEKTAMEELGKVFLNEENLKGFLGIAARFPEFSVKNLLLIHLQRPGCMELAGRKAWEAVGREVRAGGKPVTLVLMDLVHFPGEEMLWKIYCPVALYELADTDGCGMAEVGGMGGMPNLLAGIKRATGYVVQRTEEKKGKGWIDEAAGRFCIPAGFSDKKCDAVLLGLYLQGFYWKNCGEDVLGDVKTLTRYLLALRFEMDVSDISFLQIASLYGGEPEILLEKLEQVQGHYCKIFEQITGTHRFGMDEISYLNNLLVDSDMESLGKRLEDREHPVLEPEAEKEMREIYERALHRADAVELEQICEKVRRRELFCYPPVVVHLRDYAEKL